MKGIILAGGHGTRLYPLTAYTSKQLLPIYEKPMIYYPLSTLMLGNIKEIAIISTPRDIPQYKSLLGNGEKWGLEITYFEQDKPRGLADAFIICKEFIGNDSVSLILGDNVFYGNMRLKQIYGDFEEGALVFGYPVNDPERYGILEFDDSGNVLGIEEKPINPKSRYAVPGLYIYDKNVVKLATELSPSKRGEIEITDLNRKYLDAGKLKVQLLGRGVAWLDTGTADSLQDASSFIQSIEKRQSYKIGCPEEIALRMGFISLSNFSNLLSQIPDCDYKKYLEEFYKEMSIADGDKEISLGNLQV